MLFARVVQDRRNAGRWFTDKAVVTESSAVVDFLLFGYLLFGRPITKLPDKYMET